jgi:RNA polymerase sigma factor (sigma-70 family)
MISEAIADDDPAAEGDEHLPSVTAALQRLVSAGLGPAVGLRGDWRRRSAIERVARLDPEELKRRLGVIWAEHYDSFVAYAGRILGNRHDAEEVVGEAFARVLKANPDLEAPEKLPNYLRVVVRNEARDRGRQISRDREARQPHDPVDLEARLASPDRPPADKVCDEVTLAVALHVLSERQRQCFTLRFLDGLKVKDIAARLEIGEGNVKRIFHEVRARLAAAFEAAA